MYFNFRQNNAGGRFVISDEDGIGPYVWIEANTPEEANSRASEIGINFADFCECCGDRWNYMQSEWDAEEEIEVTEDDFGYHDTVYLHTLDGTIHRCR